MKSKADIVFFLKAQNPDVAHAACLEFIRTQGQSVHTGFGRTILRPGPGETVALLDPRDGLDLRRDMPQEWVDEKLADVEAELEQIREARNIG